MLKDALSFWNAIEGKVRDTVKTMSGKNLQCERYDVSTAPNSTTGLIGVKQPFGDEIFVPYAAAVAAAAVGDTVLVLWWKSMSNAKAWFMGSGPEQSRQSLFDAIYPVGSIYMSTVSANPATLFGGTWQQIEDTFLLAAGTNYAAGTTGGEAAHTLTESEMPSHTHELAYLPTNESGAEWIGAAGTAAPASRTSTVAGGGEAHNNMPPYLAVYVWKRTA